MDGTIVDISATGAHIEGAPAPEQIGGALVLQLDCFGGIGPIEFAARLVRPMEPGFAVEFTEPEPFLRALLKIALLHMEQDQERALQGSGKPR